MDKHAMQELCSNIKHLVLILDGNRRWAREHGVSKEEGYTAGANALLPVLQFGWQAGIHTITAVLGTTNSVLKRPTEETAALFRVIAILCDKLLVLAKSMNVKVVYSGRLERIPTFLKDKFCQLETVTASFNGFVLNIAFDYDAHDEMVLAVRDVIRLGISAEDLTDEVIEKFLYSRKLKHKKPELVIRTGKVSRLSALLCWDYDYSELFFSEKYFPDFTVDDLIDACKRFNRIERRFGG